MRDRKLSKEESLEVIEEMIALAKRKIDSSGFHFILWGILVIFASLAQYALLKYDFTEFAHWVWFIVPVVGLPIAFIYERRKNRMRGVRGKFDRIYGSLWLAFGITISVAVFVSISNQVNPIAFILLLIGLATFVSAVIYQFIPLMLGAVIFWITALLCPQFDNLNQLLLNAGAIFLGYIIPGIILWNKNRLSV